MLTIIQRRIENENNKQQGVLSRINVSLQKIKPSYPHNFTKPA